MQEILDTQKQKFIYATRLKQYNESNHRKEKNKLFKISEILPKNKSKSNNQHYAINERTDYIILDTNMVGLDTTRGSNMDK